MINQENQRHLITLYLNPNLSRKVKFQKTQIKSVDVNKADFIRVNIW